MLLLQLRGLTFSSRLFCSCASRRASHSCFSRALRLAFLPFVLASLLARLGQHLLLVLVHVHCVGLGGLGLGVRVDLAGPQPPGVVRAAAAARRAALLGGVLRHVQQFFVPQIENEI